MILEGAGKAFEGGWNKVKLYFMLGLPTETEDDMKGIAHLCEEIAERYYEIPKDQRNGKCQITASTSFFVPKPFTPFQWAPMCREEEFLDRARIVREEIHAQLNQKSIRYNWHEADVTVLEGILARGDRKVGDAILKLTNTVRSLMPGQSITIRNTGKRHLPSVVSILIFIPSENEVMMRSSHGISFISVSLRNSCYVNGNVPMKKP